MNKLVAAYVVAHTLLTFISSIMEGEGGLNATQLSAAINDSAVTIGVDSTQGFLTSDVILIADEEIRYTNTNALQFLNCTRGFNDTEATEHAINTNVYSPDAGLLNRGLGFNVVTTGGTAGAFSIIGMTFNFFLKVAGNMVMWDYSFFTGQLVFFRIFFMALSIGFVVYMGFSALTTAFGILVR